MISLKIALAQGFKHAANQRDQHEFHRSGYAALIEKAEWTLRHSRYWFTHLTPIQALTLCALPTDPEAPLPDGGHGSDPRKQVRYWTETAGRDCRNGSRSHENKVHPFVQKPQTCAYGRCRAGCRPSTAGSTKAA